VGFQGFASRALFPTSPTGTGADFSSASSDFRALGAFFCNFSQQYLRFSQDLSMMFV
jgi:hypothetical protein